MNEGNFAEQVEDKKARYNMTERLEEIENEKVDLDETADIEYEGDSELAVELMEAKLCEVDRSAGENFDIVDKEFDREFDKELDLHSNACNIELYYHSVNSFLNDESLKEEIVKIKNANTNANIYIILPATELVYKKSDVEKRRAELGAEIIPYIANITRGKENITHPNRERNPLRGLGLGFPPQRKGGPTPTAHHIYIWTTQGGGPPLSLTKHAFV